MFDLERARKIAAQAGNSFGADMLNDACSEIERLKGAQDEVQELREKLAEVVQERDQFGKAYTTELAVSRSCAEKAEAAEARLAEVEKERDYFAEQSKVAQKLVGTYRASAERLREALQRFVKAEGRGNVLENWFAPIAREALAADSATGEKVKADNDFGFDED